MPPLVSADRLTPFSRPTVQASPLVLPLPLLNPQAHTLRATLVYLVSSHARRVVVDQDDATAFFLELCMRNTLTRPYHDASSIPSVNQVTVASVAVVAKVNVLAGAVCPCAILVVKRLEAVA